MGTPQRPITSTAPKPPLIGNSRFSTRIKLAPVIGETSFSTKIKVAQGGWEEQIKRGSDVKVDPIVKLIWSKL